MVPALTIIGGAFALTGFLLPVVDKLAYGKVRSIEFLKL